MTRLPDRFIEDRAIRDAARAVLAEDIEHLRTSLAEEGIASRVSSGVTGTISNRIRTGARDVLEQAKAQAGDNKGVLALLVGALVLWFARGPILEWFEELLEESYDDAEVDMDSDGAPAPAPLGDPE
jgi:predicted ATPase